MKTQQPLITIGMSVHNNAKTLSVAINSILEQTYTNWEFIIFDDGSTDGTAEILEDFSDPRICVFKDSRSLGLPHRLNEIVSRANGRYFARMDGDDASLPERLERQISYLQNHPAVDLIGSGVIVFDNSGQALGIRSASLTHNEICRDPWRGFPLPHPTWMGKIEWFKRFKYDTAAKKAQDYDLLLRAYKQSHFGCLPDLLLGYRQDRLDFRKIFLSRWFTIRSQWRVARAVKSPLTFVASAAKQLAKCLIELIFICGGSAHTLLRRRVTPISPSEAQNWQQFWQRLNFKGCR
jgi:glycosyltransferase involved in cell wall biosynthesis